MLDSRIYSGHTIYADHAYQSPKDTSLKLAPTGHDLKAVYKKLQTQV